MLLECSRLIVIILKWLWKEFWPLRHVENLVAERIARLIAIFDSLWKLISFLFLGRAFAEYFSWRLSNDRDDVPVLVIVWFKSGWCDTTSHLLLFYAVVGGNEFVAQGSLDFLRFIALATLIVHLKVWILYWVHRLILVGGLRELSLAMSSRGDVKLLGQILIRLALLAWLGRLWLTTLSFDISLTCIVAVAQVVIFIHANSI